MRANSVKKFKAYTVKKKSRQCHGSGRAGALSIVGIGPGHSDHITLKAKAAIKKSDLIVGYRTYIELLGRFISDKEVISSGMTQEIGRARFAIEAAKGGRQVALISSGDPGVYGMAGLVLELLSDEERNEVEIEIIPAVTAATSCASLLGAPLMNDFAVISLSDILTDLGLIKRRIALAAQGDFVVVFYNPQSKKRKFPLKAAWEILMKYRPPETPVGIVRNAARSNEEIIITRLRDMLTAKNIDMVTTIFVGNSKTYTKGGYMITPRGYHCREAGACKLSPVVVD